MYKYLFILLSSLAFGYESVENLQPLRPTVSSAIDFQYTPTNYKNYVLAPGHTMGNVYNIGFRYGMEWNPLKNYGKLFLGGGISFTLSPNAYDLGDGTPRRFYTLPIDVHVAYHLDYFDHQVVVPFGKAGFVNTIGMLERATRGLENHFGFNLGGGAKILLNKLDSSSANNLFSNMGISYTYLVVEYLVSISTNVLSTADFSNSEIRAGIRFEI